MPKRRKLGHGIQVLFNGTAVGLLKSFKPGGASRESVNVTVIDDEVEQFLDADPPMIKPITFTTMHDREDAGDIALDTFFYNDDITEREATVALKVRNAGTGTAPAASTWTYTTVTYTGRVTDIEEAEITQKGEILRTITLQPTAKPVKS
jgi:hypothetical protein